MVNTHLLVALSGALLLNRPFPTLAAPHLGRDLVEPIDPVDPYDPPDTPPAHGGFAENSTFSHPAPVLTAPLPGGGAIGEPDVLGKPPGNFELPLSQEHWGETYWRPIEDGVFGNSYNTDVLKCAHDPIVDGRLGTDHTSMFFGIYYLWGDTDNMVGAMCGAPAGDGTGGGGWQRVSCSERSGIYIHNLSTKPLEIPCYDIGTYADWIQTACYDYYTPLPVGQVGDIKGKVEFRRGYNGQQFEVYVMNAVKGSKIDGGAMSGCGVDGFMYDEWDGDPIEPGCWPGGVCPALEDFACPPGSSCY